MPSSTVRIIVIVLKLLPLLMAFSINITMLYKEIRDIIREQWTQHNEGISYFFHNIQSLHYMQMNLQNHFCHSLAG